MSEQHLYLKLRTAAAQLRAMASGEAPVPERLRQVPFVTMHAVADWLDTETRLPEGIKTAATKDSA